MKKIAFIGTGNMGGALIKAACRSSVCMPEDILMTDKFFEKAAALAEELGCTAVPTNKEAFEGARFVLLAVKPQMMKDVLLELAPLLKASREKGEEKILVTIATGLKISFYKEVLGCEDMPFIRLMPNTPASIGYGITLVCPSGCKEDDVEELKKILAASGSFDRVEESAMDAAGALTGCTPAFAYMFIEALADGGVLAGVPRKQAQEYAARAVMGAAALVLESGKHPGLLKDEVCSPGGSTIAGVEALEEKGFRSASMEAVIAAWKKNVEMGNSNK